MHIRAIRPDDRAEWIRMRDILWPGFRADHERETQWFFTEPHASLATFVLDRSDGRLGGFIELAERPYAEGCTSSPVAYIEGWYVDSDLRRKGLGTALVRACEEWARNHGFKEIASDTDIANDISISAHKALGYEEEARIVCFRKALRDTE
jgi:aminoglycoside 6'-N-acetyltransferase I